MTELERALVARIRSEGPLTFRDFMEAALYDERHGYYKTERPKIGPSGDYYTSSNVHPAFGAVVARACVELLSKLQSEGAGACNTVAEHVCDESSGRGRDKKNHSAGHMIIEIGAGTGQLAFDVLATLKDEHRAAFDRVNYLIVESSPAMRRLQQEKLAAFAGLVRWQELQELERTPVKGVVFSNELIDAMPVHRVRYWAGRIEEQYVTVEPGGTSSDVEGWNYSAHSESINNNEPKAVGQSNRARGAQLALTWCEPSSPKLEQYMRRMRVKLSEGQIIEINLDAVEWLRRISRIIKSGFLITIDYGDVAAHLYSPERRAGTLRSFYRHALVDSPLERVGEQDMTASVNFTALVEYGRDFGFETVSFERQSAFLFRMGLIEKIAAMESASGGTPEDLKDRLAIKNLFVPGGISDNFRVLIQRK